jgi:hypothetical protein
VSRTGFGHYIVGPWVRPSSQKTSRNARAKRLEERLGSRANRDRASDSRYQGWTNPGLGDRRKTCRSRLDRRFACTIAAGCR